MEVVVSQVSEINEQTIENLIQLYLYDISELDGRDFDSSGHYRFRSIKPYFSEKDHWAFLIKLGTLIAGFSLVSKRKSWLGEDIVYSIDDFFIMRKYRGQGLGKTAAYKIFILFQGLWEVSQMEENKAAQAFWARIIGEFTGGKFLEATVLIDGLWSRPVQQFLVTDQR